MNLHYYRYLTVWEHSFLASERIVDGADFVISLIRFLSFRI